MPDKISGYTADAVSNPITADDLLDFSNTPDSGVSYDVSKKIKVSEFQTYLQANLPTIYSQDDSLAGNRTVTMGANSLTLDSPTGTSGLIISGAAMGASASGIDVNIVGTSGFINAGLFEADASSGGQVVGVRAISEGTGNGINYGVHATAKNGSFFMASVFADVEAGGTEASGFTASVHARNQTDISTTNYCVFAEGNITSVGGSIVGLESSVGSVGTGITTAIGARLSASGSTFNYALLTNGGLVGIDTLTPTEGLHVNTASRFDGNIAMNTPVLGLTTMRIVSPAGNISGINITGTGAPTLSHSISSTLSGSGTLTGIISTVNGSGPGIISAIQGVVSAAAGTFNYGGLFQSRNGSTVSAAVRAEILAGATVVPSFGTTAVNVRNSSTNGTNNWGIIVTNAATAGTNSYGIQSLCNTAGATNNIAGYFSSTMGTNNYAILVPNDQGNVGFGTLTPNATAVLDVSSSTRGMLIPRMETSNRDAIGSPATGLMIYNTSTNKINFYNGSAWEAVTSA